MRKEKAFTLVELLVVISIIAVLLAVLMPALAKVKEQARIVVCATNLKNYGPALYMYAQSNSDKCPFSFSWLYLMGTIDKDSSVCPEACRWHYSVNTPDGTLWPYLKDKNVHMCPTFRNIAMVDRRGRCGNEEKGHSNRLVKLYNAMYSYSMNRWLGMYCPELYTTGDPSKQKELLSVEPSLKLSRVKRTAYCFAFSEENPSWVMDGGVAREDDDKHHPYRNGDTKAYNQSSIGKNDLWMYKLNNGHAEQNFATYHGVTAKKRDEGKANVIFVDGHTKLVRGLPGYDAYLEYGRPYYGHENLNNEQSW